MESEFNNWYEKWTGSKVKCENTDIIGAWQHQQSKLDELQANFDQHDQWLGQRNRDVQELNDIIAKHAAEKDELQKRVDAALEITKQGIRKQGGDYYLEKLEQALNGGDE